MPKDLRPLLIALPSVLAGALLTATLTTTARAQDEAPKVRLGARYAEWEYRDYFCGEKEACAQKGGEGAYDELDKLGADGWEAYAYNRKDGSGFDWELKRRK